MKTIEKITVNGETYRICDPEAARVNDHAIGKDPWSSLHVLDRLCPPFHESGSIVQCRPVEGYPLGVTVTPGATIYRCGKNLFDYTVYPFADRYINHTNGASVASSGYSAFEEYMPIWYLRGHTITLNHPACEKAAATNAGLAFYDAEKNYISGSNGYTHTVPGDAAYMRFSVPREWVNGVSGLAADLQVELGSQVTAFEANKTPEIFASYEDVPAWSGINTLWSDDGEITVTGRTDPIPLLTKLLEQ